MLARRLIQRIQAVAADDAVKDHAVQRVDVRPRQFAAAHAVHRHGVAGAPVFGEGRAVDLQAVRGGERAGFGSDAAVPIDDRAEHIESQGFGLERLH